MIVKPLVSIIIPTYNRSHLISRTIESILAQTYDNWECIIVDDFSTDNTRELLSTYSIKDSRFKVLTNQNKKGAQGSRNTGVLNSIGDWIIFFDSDNVMKNTFIESLLSKVLIEKKDICSCFSNVIDFDSSQIVDQFNWIATNTFKTDVMTGDSYVDFNCAIINKKKLLEIDLLDEMCPSFQEWDTHIRLSKISEYTTTKKVLVDYYVGGKDSISSNKEKEILGYLYLLEKHKDDWRKNHFLHFFKYGLLTLKLIKKNSKQFNQHKQKLYKIIPELRFRFIYKNLMKLKILK